MFGKKYYLVADVGGTNVTIGILDKELKILVKQHYLTKNYKTFYDLLKEFLKDIYNMDKRYTIAAASFAIAGPVNVDRKYAKLTNNPWLIEVLELEKILSIKKILLLNDFEALGFSYEILKPDQYIELTDNGRNPGTSTIIGAGTGLGVSILYYDDYKKKYEPLPSEGGHIMFSINPSNKIELELYDYLSKNKKIKDTEALVSGYGIINIYNFLLTKKIKHSSKAKSEIKNSSDLEKPEIISKYALQSQDPLCMKTLELFITFYARFSQILVVGTSSLELLIAGGIAPKIFPSLKDLFLHEFVQHDQKHIRSMLEKCCVMLLMDHTASLYGAAVAVKY